MIGTAGADPGTPNASGLYSNSNNQVTASFGWSYAGSGNVPQAGPNAGPLTYDAEKRQLTATVSGTQNTFEYPGEGRVHKTAPEGQTTYMYDALGDLAAEYGHRRRQWLGARRFMTLTSDVGTGA